jgi:HTH-type transcriptional regulator/antitoxin HigA
MEIKVIKTEEQYTKAMVEIERLVAIDPAPGTPEADKLDLLSVLVEAYENEHYRFDLPDPIDAIRFRMEEQGLSQKDLVPYIGSKSKVSEVLSRKRPLSLSMMKALHEELGIPAEVLLQDSEKHKPDESEIDWSLFPIAELVKRGWISATKEYSLDNAKEVMGKFFAGVGIDELNFATYRRTLHSRSGKEANMYSLLAWIARVLKRGKEKPRIGKYKTGIVTKSFLTDIVHLSLFEKGPLLAKEFLSKNGIALIIEEHLPQTKIDGCAIMADEGWPIIGLTLRYDRIDYFWYTLIHELSHVAKNHLTRVRGIFIDDDIESDVDDQMEREADKLTKEVFIPRSIWPSSDAYIKRTPEAINQLAQKLRIHPAIIAGRIRRETNSYYLLENMVGQGEVKRMFKKT